MIPAIASLGIFTLITLFYIIIKYFIVDKSYPKSSFGIALTLFYFVVNIAAQTFINMNNAKSLCNGAANNIPAIIHTIVPNVLLMGPIVALLNYFPSWLKPFSNTLGYAIVKIFTNLSFLEKFPTQRADKVLIQKDKSLFLNEFTPSNYATLINKFSSSNPPLINGGNLKNPTPAMKELWSTINIKSNIALFVWLILTGSLVISYSYNAVLNIVCRSTTEEKEKAAKDFDKEQAENQKNKPVEGNFKI